MIRECLVRVSPHDFKRMFGLEDDDQVMAMQYDVFSGCLFVHVRGPTQPQNLAGPLPWRRLSLESGSPKLEGRGR